MQSKAHKILLVDDNPEIHEDFKRILQFYCDDTMADFESELFGDVPVKKSSPSARFELHSVFQGQAALLAVESAIKNGERFSMAFIDIRMPPGWNGIETIQRLWKVDPELDVVICTAYSDYSWNDIVVDLGNSDRFLILKKPFEAVEVRQMAMSLCAKSDLSRSRATRMAELEQAVQDRTGQLQRALESAEEASRSKTAFLANMSHEIRTPMTAIMGYADILMEDADSPGSSSRRSDAIGTIRRNGEHLLELINDILDLSKIEARKLTTESRVCPVVELVNDVIALMQVRADAKNLLLSAEFASPIPETILTDPTRVKQILVNLVGNAIKFTETGSVRLVVRYLPGALPHIEFDVIDTGIGIREEHCQNLFKPFIQADTSVTRCFGGTGLGLAICKRLAELLGGDIVLAESTPGIGSMFRVTIKAGCSAGVRISNPSQKADATQTHAAPSPLATPTANSPEKPSATPQALLAGYNILIAEDGPDNQKLISHILRKAGAAVELAENGSLAYDRAMASLQQGQPFDVILMDMQMPVMDGYEATSSLRRSEYGGTIIALTAHAMAGDRDRCIAAGCDDYATKPIQRQLLLDLIRSYPCAQNSKVSCVAETQPVR